MSLSHNLKVIPLDELELLAHKADEYANRYDIPEEVYQSLFDEQEAYWVFMQENPDCYGSEEAWKQASVHNRFIALVLLIRLNEIAESKYEVG